MLPANQAGAAQQKSTQACKLWQGGCVQSCFPRRRMRQKGMPGFSTHNETTHERFRVCAPGSEAGGHFARSFTRSHALEVLEADEGSGTDGGAKKLLEKLLLAQILTIEHHADTQW